MAEISRETIDEAVVLSKQIAKAEKRLEEIKELIKNECKATGQREFKGIEGIAKVTDTTTWTVPPISFLNYIKKLKGKNWESFFSLFVTVKHGEIKNKLGVDVLSSIGTQETKVATTVRFTG